MNDLPEPLVASEIDLRGFEWMPIFGEKLFKSETWVLASAEGKVAALKIWWHAFAMEVPAGSLPNDERLLASYAGYEAAPKLWKKIRAEVMRGWKLCSDGRLYHPFLAEKVVPKAWAARKERVAGQKRLENWRKKQKEENETPDETPDETGFETHSKTVSKPRRQRQGQIEEGGGGSADAPEAIPAEVQQPKNAQPVTEPAKQPDGTADLKANRNAEAIAMAGDFKSLRDRFWPNDPTFPAIPDILRTQALTILENGGNRELVMAVVERGMQKAAGLGKTASGSFGAFKNSISDAIASHRAAPQTMRGTHDGTVPPSRTNPRNPTSNGRPAPLSDDDWRAAIAASAFERLGGVGAPAGGGRIEDAE